MFQEYLQALVFMMIIAGASGLFILVSRLLTPEGKNKYGKTAQENYESGFKMLSDTDQRFAVPYFRPALFSGVLILLVLLLFPLALVFTSLGGKSLFLLAVLMVLGIGGFIYALKKGLLSW
ncbi:MAG: NADH-quinone oxidoreductase subunit A [Alphaproteobacteria bacterium]|nr:NADH-quinone oxidoreductase subunit A [Alphaproteobacteria bacterium]